MSISLAMYVRNFVRGYVVCALWSSTDDECEPLDGLYTVSDIDSAAMADMEADCRAFVEDNWTDLMAWADRMGYGAETAGHDFWLTRNGHGAGFWDRGAGDIGDRLTDASKAYGSSDLYVGDDGFVHAA